MDAFWQHHWICLALVAVVFGVLVFRSAGATSYPRENPVVEAVRKVSPAVVNVSSEYVVTERSNPFFDFGIDPFFDSFFRDFFDPHYQRRYEGQSLGSGVIIDGKQGYVLTNEHVIARGTEIRVVLKDEREFKAQVVGAAPDFDLAILKIDSDAALPAIEMGDSDDLMIGETIIAIGNPFGFSHTVTTGVVSAVNRSVQTEGRTYRDFIQTDASINPGNSGGPLLNVNGELVGISTAIYAKAQGIGFAIPINKAKRVMEDLIKYGEIQIPWLGLFVQDLGRDLARYFQIPPEGGVVVTEVTPSSPAQEAGVQPGDVVTGLGKMRVESKAAYHDMIRDYSPGDEVTLTVQRGGDERVIQVRSRPFPESLAEDLGYKSLGVRVQELSDTLRPRFGISAREGVMVTEIRRGAYLDRIGVRPGDVIRKINEVVIKGLDDFKNAVIKYRQKEYALLIIQRGDQQYNVTVKMEI